MWKPWRWLRCMETELRRTGVHGTSRLRQNFRIPCRVKIFEVMIYILSQFRAIAVLFSFTCSLNSNLRLKVQSFVGNRTGVETFLLLLKFSSTSVGRQSQVQDPQTASPVVAYVDSSPQQAWPFAW